MAQVAKDGLGDVWAGAAWQAVLDAWRKAPPGMRPTFASAIDVVTQFWKTYADQGITAADLESRLKAAGIPLHLFAEDPSKSAYARVGIVPKRPVKADPLTLQPATYMLSFSDKARRDAAALDMETGCRDVNTNLARLQDAGLQFLETPMEDNDDEARMSLAMMTELLSKAPPSVPMGLRSTEYSKLKRLLQTNEAARQQFQTLCEERHLTITRDL
jgi:hypothetical protein